MADETKFIITATGVMVDPNERTLAEYDALCNQMLETIKVTGNPLDPKRIYSRWGKGKKAKRGE